MEQNEVDLKKDRRAFERIPVELPVRLLDLTSSKEIDAHTWDVSADGLGIVSRQLLKKRWNLEECREYLGNNSRDVKRDKS